VSKLDDEKCSKTMLIDAKKRKESIAGKYFIIANIVKKPNRA